MTPTAAPQTTPTSHPVLETLEPRLAPAGIVTVSLSPQGQLSLSGDAAENHVTILGNANGSWSLYDPTHSTTFRYQGADSLGLDFTSPLKGIKTNLKGGNDILTLENLTLTGRVTLQDGHGNDSVTLINNTLHGPVKITTGAGADTLALLNNHLSSQLTIHTGLGATAST